MEKQKRRQRAYKITDKHYDKAMKRAKRDKIPVATLVETFLMAYGDNALITFVKK